MIFASFSALSLAEKFQVNIFRTAIVVLFFSLLASCKKEEEVAPVPLNSWWYASDTMTTGYTDLDTRRGYRISFFPAGTIALDHSLTLQFSEYPHEGSDYQVTADSPTAGKVRILLQAGALPIYKPKPVSGSVRVEQTDGKFSFRAAEVAMIRDTTIAAADALILGFQVHMF